LNDDNSQIDLKNYWAILGRRKALLILPLMIVPLVAFAITYFMPASYVSSAIIMLSETNVLPQTVERDIEGRSATYDYSRISIQERQSSYYNQITSTKYLRRLIATLNLPIDESIKKTVAATKASFPQISENDLAENILADELRSKVTVNMKASNLVEVSFSAPDPVNAQRMAASLADIFVEENLAAELAGVRSSISFSEEQLAFYKEKLKSAEDKLREFRQSLLATSFGEDTSTTNLTEVAAAVQALDLEISDLQDRQADLRTQIDVQNVDVADLTLPAQIMTARDELTDKTNKLSDLLANFNWKDVRIYSLNEESRQLIQSITDEIRAWVEKRFAEEPREKRETIIDYLAGNVTLDFNRSKRTTLDNYISKTQIRLGEDPATEVTMDRLQSEIDSYKKFYDLFVSHSQNAAISQSAKKVEAEAKYVIIKPASLPLSPDSPKRVRIFGMGVALGLALGFGAIMMVELLDNSFKKVEDVQEYLSLPVIGTVPRMELPFGGGSRRRLPIAIGVSVSFVLVLLIIFLNFKKNG